MSSTICDYHIQPDQSIQFRQRNLAPRQVEKDSGEDSISYRVLQGYALGNLLNRQMHRTSRGRAAEEIWKSFLAGFSVFTSCTQPFLKQLKACMNKYFDDEGNRNALGIQDLGKGPKWEALYKLFQHPKAGLDSIIESIRQRTVKDSLDIHGHEIIDLDLSQKAELLQLIRTLDKMHEAFFEREQKPQ